MDFVLERMHKENADDPSERYVLNERGQSYTCGRGRENHIICLSMVASRKHCIFFHSNDSLYVSDLQSTNGIFINGNRQRSLQMIKLCENDIIGIGCSDTNPGNNDNVSYIFRVCIIKTSFDEEAENSILSRTLLNVSRDKDTVKRSASSAAPAERNLGEECSTNSVNCDTIMPSKVPKYKDNNFHNSRIIHTEEIKSSDRDKQSPQNHENSSNKEINSTKAKSDVYMEIDDDDDDDDDNDDDDDDDDDDDIKIIHTSLVKGPKTRLNENRYSEPAKRLGNDSTSDSASNTSQHTTRLSQDCRMDVNVDNNDNNINDNGDKIDATSCFAEKPNLRTNDDQMVKFEDELQLTDDDEEANVTANGNKTICEPTPIKLKKVKHEPKTRFSEVDVVDLSDDEDGVFPYSQLFDIKYENDAEKVSIKQECVDYDDQNNAKIGLLNVDDEVIILTDDEDEANPWLERLSRSQLLNEEPEREPEPEQAIVKNEIDYGIWENDEISHIIRSEVSSDDREIPLASQTNEKDDGECEKSTKIADSTAVKSVESMDVTDVSYSKEISLEKTDSASKRKTDVEHVQMNKRKKKPDNIVIESGIPKDDDKLPRRMEKPGRKSEKRMRESERLTREPEKKNLARESQKLTRESEKPAREPEKLARGSERSVREFEKPAREPKKPARKSEKLSRESKKLVREREKPAREFEKSPREPEKLTREPEKLPSESEKVTKESERLAREPEKVVKESGNQAKKSETLTIMPRALLSELEKIAREPGKLTKELEKPTRESEKPIKETNDNLERESDLMNEADNLTEEFDALMKEPDDQTEESKNTSATGIKIKSVKRCFVTTTKRLIPIIEAQNLPVRRRGRGEHSKEKQRDAQKRTEEKPQSTTPKKEALKLQILKEQLNENFYGKQRKRHKEAYKSACDSHTQNEAKDNVISKEKKKELAELRKAKLKEIAEEKKKLTAGSKTVKRGTAKPRAKVSLKNRGDFLVPSDEAAASVSLPDKSAKASSRSSDNPAKSPNEEMEISKYAPSNAENHKLRSKNNLPKGTVTNIAISLEQSLHLDTTIDIPVIEESSIPELKAIIKEKKYHRTSHEIASDLGTEPLESGTSKSCERIPPILVQKENFSPNSKSAEKSNLRDWMKSELDKLKKKVSFLEKVDVRYYEIEPHNSLKRLVGKDAPIPSNKLSKKAKTTCAQWQCPKLEEFLFRIFKWNPVWLEEQRYFKRMPPIVSNNELQPMKLSYSSYQEYYKVAMPLLLLEIWYSMSKDFDNVDKNKQRATAMCFIVENSVTHTPISSSVNLSTLTIEILSEKQDLNKQTHPIYGDLVSFEYVGTKNGKQSFHKTFAYVINMHETVITNFTHYNKDLKNYVADPYAVVTYTLLTRSIEHNIAINRVHRVRTVTYLRASIRMVQALQYLPQSPLLNQILNPKIEDYKLPPMNEVFLASSSKLTESNLNPKQVEAVYRVSEAVLRKEPKLCFIQGPPGTGKSKVIVNLVSRILYDEQNKKSLKILVCAPSNAATDEIVLRLLAVRSSFKPKRFNMVRIGRLESMHPTAKNISVTELAKRYIIQTANQSSVEEELTDMQTRMNSLQNSLLASSHSVNENKRKETEKKLLDLSVKYEVLKLLDGKPLDQVNAKVRAKIQRLSEDIILRGADVITCTLSSCYTNQMESIFGSHDNRIPICIVDEATQSCEAETLIPLMLGVNTMVLVGDPNQLPATVLSQEAKKLGLDQSVFSRVQTVFASQPNSPIIMLDTQYRMDYAISYWPNKYFYGGKLKNAVQTKPQFPFYSYRVLNHNSAQNNDRFSNTTEAEFVANIIFCMLAFARWDNLGENGCVSIGVLTPYNIQRTLVLNKINEKISPLPESLKKKITFEVNTVDGFQGQERDVIIMSCVRSHGIGFLSDRQRLCVALTRAKQSLILCGNFTTFMKDQMWKGLLTDARSRGVLCNIDAHARPAKIEKFIVK